MKKIYLRQAIFLLIAMIIFSCEKESEETTDIFEVSISEETNEPGSNISYATGISIFVFVKTPSTKNGALSNGIWMSQTETTYKLWEEVYNWAIANGYEIVSDGMAGSSTSFTDDHPVTTVCWYDAVVWCNALTEYYNSANGDKIDYTYAYTYNGEPVKNSAILNEAFESLTYNYGATGFRIPTNDEWHAAASYGNIPDGYACGAFANYENTNANCAVAWYRENSGGQTHPVKQKMANALQLYDVSGNVSEIVFDRLGMYDGKYNIRGGAWNSNPDQITITASHPVERHTKSYSVGFRMVRTPGIEDYDL